jgi:ComF family protein
MRVLPAIMETAAALLRMANDVVFPPRCPSCRAYVEADGNFCSACFSKLRMIDAPLCACCGIPFVVVVEAETRCPTCLDSPPDFDVARAALVYDGISAPLITALKFHDQWAGLSRYTQMMLRLGRPLLEGADMLIPVPLHWRRLLRRKFNQSALLAYSISDQTGVPCMPDVLERVHYTKPQMRLSRAERLKNVKRAFAVSPEAEALLTGKTVVLVDDVVTTGATANACALALKKAGAREVRVLALARTVKE